MRRIFCSLACALFACGWLAHAQEESAICPADENTAWRAALPPDFAETFSASAIHNFPAVATPQFSPMVPSARQPAGALSERIVFMNSGHGWTWSTNNFWYLQRPVALNSMNEDYGNWDQLNHLPRIVSMPARSSSPCGHSASRRTKSCSIMSAWV